VTYRRVAAISPVVFTLLLACNGGTVIDDSCFVDLAPITARTSVVSVGDTVSFDANLGPAQCLPAGIDSEDWRWSSSDTLIARIDSLTGLAQATGPGDALIRVDHAKARGQVESVTPLHVVAD
jgi:hypothetical protein